MNNKEIVQQELPKKKELFHPVNPNHEISYVILPTKLDKYLCSRKEPLRKQRALIIPYNGNASLCGVNG